MLVLMPLQGLLDHVMEYASLPHADFTILAPETEMAVSAVLEGSGLNASIHNLHLAMPHLKRPKVRCQAERCSCM